MSRAALGRSLTFGTMTWLASMVPTAGQTSSAWFQTGNQLHELCQASEARSTAYLMGVVDEQAFKTDMEGAKGSFCVPENVTAKQVRDVTCRYLSDHPGRRHFRAAWLATLALTEAFPCR